MDWTSEVGESFRLRAFGDVRSSEDCVPEEQTSLDVVQGMFAIRMHSCRTIDGVWTYPIVGLRSFPLLFHFGRLPAKIVMMWTRASRASFLAVTVSQICCLGISCLRMSSG